MPNDSIQGMKLWEKSDTACRITKQRHDIWVKITNNMSEPLYKACDTCKKSPNHVRSLCTRHENREKSLAACYSQVNLYVFNIPSLQLIQFQPSLLFSESEPEAIIPSHTEGACHWRVLRKTLQCWIRRCEKIYCSHHPHRRRGIDGVFLRLSQWWRKEPQYKLNSNRPYVS